MSQISSPIKQSKDRLRFSSGSYKNIQLHSALDEAKHYSNLVNHHLTNSLQENHVLHTAKAQYQQPLNRLTKTSSLSSRQLTKRLSASIEVKDSNPESAPLIHNFSSKTQRIPQIGELFKMGIEEERSLRKMMKELKDKIRDEKKNYDRIYTRTCKMMNEEDNAFAHINKMDEDSRNNQILIQQLEGDCNSLNQQLQRLQDSNIKCVSKIEEVGSQVEEYVRVTGELKRHLASEVQRLGDLKGRQGVAYRAMMNDYMMINQLKEEKALLLNHVDQDIRKNQ